MNGRNPEETVAGSASRRKPTPIGNASDKAPPASAAEREAAPVADVGLKPFRFGTATAGDEVLVDLERFLAERMLVQGNSGSGKSTAAEEICLQTKGQIQQFIIDADGQFRRLRESGDYIVAAKAGGQCVATQDSAAVLAQRLLQLNTSAVLDIAELTLPERREFVKRFLESMMEASEELWHPVLVVVDEAHNYAPQRGNAVSTPAVIDLMSRGRRRGFCGVLVTQRIAKLHKDAVSEAGNKVIGRTVGDVDIKRVGDELGLGKSQRNELRDLAPGTFRVIGSAFSTQLAEAKVDFNPSVAAKRWSSPGPAKPSPQIEEALRELRDLPAEAESEPRTVARLQDKIEELERALRARRPVGDSAAEVQRRVDDAVRRARADATAEIKRREARLRVAENRIPAVIRRVDSISADVRRLRGDLSELLPTSAGQGRPAELPRRDRRGGTGARRQSRATSGTPPAGEEQLPSGAARMLRVLAECSPTTLSKEQWATLAGLKPTSGTFGKYVSALFACEYVSRQDRGYTSTRAGSERIGRDGLRRFTAPEWLRRWEDAIGRAPARVLREIVTAHPDGVTREELATNCGLSPSSGTFNSYCALLLRKQLAEVRDRRMCIGSILFAYGAPTAAPTTAGE